jgi:hypothetical protein
MKRIQNVMETLYNLRTETNQYNEHIHAVNDTVIAEVVFPHSGTDGKWMLRITPFASFDRWANSCAIEKFFDSADEVSVYLETYRIDIYRKLLDYLSSDYEELTEVLK